MSIAIKEDIVREILQVTGDPKSVRFYRKVGTGVYFYRLSAGEFTSTKKMIFLH